MATYGADRAASFLRYLTMAATDRPFGLSRSLRARLRVVSTRTRQIAQTVLVLGVLGILFYWQFAPRPEGFGLAMMVDGAAPSDAAGVVLFLHGLGRGLAQGEDVARRLRSAGLTSDISIVIARAPYRFGLFGFSWGNTPKE